MGSRHGNDDSLTSSVCCKPRSKRCSNAKKMHLKTDPLILLFDDDNFMKFCRWDGSCLSCLRRGLENIAYGNLNHALSRFRMPASAVRSMHHGGVIARPPWLCSRMVSWKAEPPLRLNSFWKEKDINPCLYVEPMKIFSSQRLNYFSVQVVTVSFASMPHAQDSGTCGRLVESYLKDTNSNVNVICTPRFCRDFAKGHGANFYYTDLRCFRQSPLPTTK